MTTAFADSQPTALADANAGVLRAFYDAFTSNDLDAATRWVTDDFVMHVPGAGPNAGEHWGKEGLRRFMTNILAHIGGTFSLEITAVAFGERAAFTREVVCANRKRDPGIEWELRFVMEYRFKAGLISEAWTVPEDLDVYDAFWKSPAGTRVGSAAPNATATVLDLVRLRPFDRAISPENEALVFGFYDRFWRGDMAGVAAMYADDFVFETFGHSALAGAYHGFAGYLEFREKLIARMGDRYKLEIDSIAAGQNDVFVREHVRMNRKAGAPVRSIYVILHIIVRDGELARIDDVPVDIAAYDRFFA